MSWTTLGSACSFIVTPAVVCGMKTWHRPCLTPLDSTSARISPVISRKSTRAFVLIFNLFINCVPQISLPLSSHNMLNGYTIIGNIYRSKREDEGESNLELYIVNSAYFCGIQLLARPQISRVNNLKTTSITTSAAKTGPTIIPGFKCDS